jgi:hypothetical protein
MLGKTRRIFRDKLNPLLFTSTAQQLNRIDMKNNSIKHEYNSLPPYPVCYKIVVPMEVVIYHKLRIE